DRPLQVRAQDLGDAPHQQDRDVAFTCLQLREIALGQAGVLRKLTAREPRRLARVPHASAEFDEVGRLLVGLAWELDRHAPYRLVEGNITQPARNLEVPTPSQPAGPG